MESSSMPEFVARVEKKLNSISRVKEIHTKYFSDERYVVVVAFVSMPYYNYDYELMDQLIDVDIYAGDIAVECEHRADVFFFPIERVNKETILERLEQRQPGEDVYDVY